MTHPHLLLHSRHRCPRPLSDLPEKEKSALRILQGIRVGLPSLTQLVAICEQMLDLSDAGPELIGRGGAERRERVAKHALQDQSPRTQGLKVG